MAASASPPWPADTRGRRRSGWGLPAGCGVELPAFVAAGWWGDWDRPAPGVRLSRSVRPQGHVGAAACLMRTQLVAAGDDSVRTVGRQLHGYTSSFQDLGCVDVR